MIAASILFNRTLTLGTKLDPHLFPYIAPKVPVAVPQVFDTSQYLGTYRDYSGVAPARLAFFTGQAAVTLEVLRQPAYIVTLLHGTLTEFRIFN